jgi:hypothetical protein
VPNDAHYTLAQLEFCGILKHIITQNVDRLHQKSGSVKVTDLHGRNDVVRCLNCGYHTSRKQFQYQLEQLNSDVLKDHFARLNSIDIRSDGDMEFGSNEEIAKVCLFDLSIIIPVQY